MITAAVSNRRFGNRLQDVAALARLNALAGKARGPSQDRHRRYSNKKHPQFHGETRNDERAIGFQRGERVVHDLFN